MYFTATEKSPTERHLYSTSLDTHRSPQRSNASRKRTACTASSMSPDTRFYVDRLHEQHAAAAGQSARSGRHLDRASCSKTAWMHTIRMRPTLRTIRSRSSAP